MPTIYFSWWSLLSQTLFEMGDWVEPETLKNW